MCANLNPKNLGIDIYSGFRKNGQGGVQIKIIKNPGIDFYSGFRKNLSRGLINKQLIFTFDTPGFDIFLAYIYIKPIH